MATLTRQLVRIFLFFMAMTAFAALSALPTRAAPFAAHVMDARTGETLYAKNADTRLHPASLTKMLTLYIVFDAIERGEISLDTKVTVTAHAAGQQPSRLGLRAGQRIALRYLIRAAAVKSANDAATAIGDALSGNDAKFAARMNRTAKAIGMKSSTFKNANGLTAAGHLSTARDMSTLGRRLFYDFPQYYNIFSRRTADAGMAEVANTNRRFLDAYKGADGIKTGYTVAAGFNLTASAERGQKRIIATVFGGTSTAQRNAKMMELMDLGFGEAPATARVQKPAPADLPAEVPDLLADSEGAEGGAGKTIRVSTVMKTSPRPVARPGARPGAQPAVDAEAEAVMAAAAADAEAAAVMAQAADAQAAAALDAKAVAAAEMVGAMQPSIADALAAAAEPPPEVPTPDAPPPEAPTPVVMARVEDAATLGRAAKAPPARPATLIPAEALAEVAAPLPFAMVNDDGQTLVPAGAPAPDQGEAAPAEAEAPEAVALAKAPPLPDAPPPAAPMPFTVVDADGTPVPPAGEALPFAVIDPADLPPAEMPDETTVVALAAPAPVLRPLPTLVAEAEPEVVTRLSTSGGRNWGVSLGQMPSRGAAERILTRTTLTEGQALGDGLRKVVPRGGGYDATVLGLTEEQASLACRRLTARAMDCTMIGP